MSDATTADLLELAKKLAMRAADISRGSGRQVAVTRKADNTVVTETDHAIQAMILDALADTCPDHAVVAEEDVARPGCHANRAQARYCWVIDPLDGTRNYVAGIPCFCTSIAVLDQGRPVVGVVLEHNLGLMFWATLGGGAYKDGRRITVGTPGTGRDVLVGIPSSKSRLSVAVLRQWVARPGLVTRNFGAVALHLAMVASGALDAAFSVKGRIWDVAAGALLITEAGGRFTDTRGDDPFPLTPECDVAAPIPALAGYPGLHRELLESMQEALRADAP